MVRASRFRGQQQKNQIHRLIVERLKIDWLVEPPEQAEQPAELRQLAVWNCNPVAYGGRAKLFALKENLENCFLVLASEFRCTRGKLLDRLFFIVDLESGNYRVWR